MEFRNLATVVRAAELHSFSQAARQLGYSQSAVSMQIGQLESELGAPLFDRVGKTIALTPQGLSFFKYAQNILRMADEAKGVMKNAGAVSGQLRIAMAESIGISMFPHALTRFHRRYPEVRLTVMTGTTGDMFRALAQNDVDMIFHLDNPIFRSDTVVALSQSTPIVFVAPAGHPLGQESEVPVGRIVQEPFILTEKGMSYRSQLDSQLAELGLQIDPFLEFGNTDVVARLVEEGLGLSFLPEFVVRDRIDRGGVIRLNVPGIRVALYTQLIYHKGKWMTPAMQAMIDIIREESAG